MAFSSCCCGKQMVVGEINICFSQFLSTEYWLFLKTPLTFTGGLLGSFKLLGTHFIVIKHPAVMEWLMVCCLLFKMSCLPAKVAKYRYISGSVPQEVLGSRAHHCLEVAGHLL